MCWSSAMRTSSHRNASWSRHYIAEQIAHLVLNTSQSLIHVNYWHINDEARRLRYSSIPHFKEHIRLYYSVFTLVTISDNNPKI